MDKNSSFVIEKKIERAIAALNKNRMCGYVVQDEKELIEKIEEIVSNGASVAVGGSMTLFETGIIDYLRGGRYTFYDRYKKGLTPAEIKEIFRKSFSADAYFASTNALTENGELYNVDGNGNRVAAMLYGPDKVIIIVGYNKIVKDLDEAVIRAREMASPANAKRLNKETPCVKVGYCMDCSSDGRICSDYVVIRKQTEKNRIHVIIVNKELGY